MSRFSAGRRPQDLGDVEQPALAEDRHDRRLGGHQLAQVRVRLGPVRPVAGRPEGGQPGGLPADLPGGREELDVLRVRARPAALDVGHPVLVEHPGDPELVGQRQDDVLALGPVAQGRVVEDDRRGRRPPGRGSVMRVGVGVGHGTGSQRGSGSGRFRRSGGHRVRRRPTDRDPVRDRPGHAGRPDPGQAVGRAARGGPQVGGPEAVVEGRAHGGLDRLGRGGPAERPAQEHRPGQDRPDRVGQVAPGDVGRRAVDRLVQAVQAVARSGSRPTDADGSMPERAGQDGRLVRQDVAEQVLGDEDVEGGRPLHELHRAGVDEAVLELDVRELAADLVGDPPPEPRGGQDVGLVDAGDAVAAGRGRARRRGGRPGSISASV